jgi:hypothetical protein
MAKPKQTKLPLKASELARSEPTEVKPLRAKSPRSRTRSLSSVDPEPRKRRKFTRKMDTVASPYGPELQLGEDGQMVILVRGVFVCAKSSRGGTR